MRPSCSRATRSASCTVEGRCATMRPVVVASTRRSAASTSASVSTSSARQRVVEHEHRRVGGDGAREGEALALAAGEAQALLPHHRVDAVRQAVHEGGLGDVERLGEHALGLRRVGGVVAQREVGATEQHVVAHARREQRRVLEGHGDVAAQLGARLRSRMSTPSSVTRPPVTSYRRVASAVSVVLPLPVMPTSAIVSPGSRARSMSVERGGLGESGILVAEVRRPRRRAAPRGPRSSRGPRGR